jgi:hypothetical protein
MTYSLIDVVCAELHSRVWHNAYTVGTVSGHEASPALFPPHLSQCLGDRHFVFFATNTLDLKQDLKAFERGYDGSRYSARYAASNKRSQDWLREDLANALQAGDVWRAEGLR